MEITISPKRFCREAFLLPFHYITLMKKTCTHLTEIREKVCWKIIKPDLADKPTESKYCQWKENHDYIRRFDAIGFMTPSTNDAMITKYCTKCNQPVLLKIKEEVCAFCRQVY